MNDLPSEICLTERGNGFQLDDDVFERLNEAINDYLSDTYGFCVNGYDYQLTISDIDWDTEE